jgi:hypothetical protein
MSALVLRLWVLLLAILFQASHWNAAARFWASTAVGLAQGGTGSDSGRDDVRGSDLQSSDVRSSEPRGSEPRGSDSRDRSAGDRDMPEDGTKELSAVDDVACDGVPAEFPDCCNPPPGDCSYAWVDGLSPGGAPADVPFKPPRG